jgi:hypothetical protein
MSNNFDKQSIVERLAEALGQLSPKSVNIKFDTEVNTVQIKIISDIFESMDHLERLKSVSDIIYDILTGDLSSFEALIIPLTECEGKNADSSLDFLLQE